MDDQELIFIYNANSGKLNAYLDTLHKIFSPKTYPCSLCDITYGYLGIKEDWAAFKETIPVKMRFLHKDEWKAEFDRDVQLPAVFMRQNTEVRSFITAEQLNAFSLEELKVELQRKLSF
jgi:hypothetical protein